MLLRKPIFQGENVETQLGHIIDVLGTPSEVFLTSLGLKNPVETMKKFSYDNKFKKDWEILLPGSSAKALDLVEKMLQFDYTKRISAKEALKHQFFDEIRDLVPQNDVTFSINEDST
jgi:serine/threonine protein kinase